MISTIHRLGHTLMRIALPMPSAKTPAPAGSPPAVAASDFERWGIHNAAAILHRLADRAGDQTNDQAAAELQAAGDCLKRALQRISSPPIGAGLVDRQRIERLPK